MSIKQQRLLNGQHLSYNVYCDRCRKGKDVSRPYQGRGGIRIKEGYYNIKEQWKLGHYGYSYSTYIRRIENNIPLDKPIDKRGGAHNIKKGKKSLAIMK